MKTLPKAKSEKSCLAKTRLVVEGDLAPWLGSAVGPDDLDDINDGGFGGMMKVVRKKDRNQGQKSDGGDDLSVVGGEGERRVR